MRSHALPALLLAALTSSACFQMTTVLKVNGDGSGTIEHRMVYSKAALAQLRQFAALGGRGQSADPASETITLSISHEANGNAVLHINVPEPNFVEALGKPGATGQIAMIKSLLAGARVLLAVEPAGPVVRTSSPYVEGQRVTLLEIDLDEALKDETLLPRLQAAATPDDAKAVIKGVAGIKINLDREITVEFTPAK
jgi:hypothetical protein